MWCFTNASFCTCFCFFSKKYLLVMWSKYIQPELFSCLIIKLKYYLISLHDRYFSLQECYSIVIKTLCNCLIHTAVKMSNGVLVSITWLVSTYRWTLCEYQSQINWRKEVLNYLDIRRSWHANVELLFLEFKYMIGVRKQQKNHVKVPEFISNLFWFRISVI